MTDKQKKEHIASPARCPFCKSRSIVGDLVDIEDNRAVQMVDCSSCGRSWKDIYVLTTVEG